MTDELNDLIKDFLAERRTTDSGWAEVTDNDYMDLFLVIRKLLEEKFDKDADGDLPIELKLINRNTHKSMHYMPVEYSEWDAKTRAEALPHVLKRLQRTGMNLGIAESEHSQVLRELQFITSEDD